MDFVINELEKIKVLSKQRLKNQMDDEKVFEDEDDEQRRTHRKAFMMITINFLRRMRQEQLADYLQSSKQISIKI